MVFSDFCVREDHIDALLFSGFGPSESWEPGSLAYDYAEMKKVDSAVAMSYAEALFKNDWYLDEEDGKWKGCPKGGPPSMRPGLPTIGGVSVHATWKQHEFGFGPYATTQRRFVSIDKDIRRARATFDDAICTGVDMTNPFSDPGIVALVGLLRRFIDDEPGAGLEAVGLVHKYNFGNGNKGYTSIRIWWKKSCAAAVGGRAHHHGRDAWRLRGGRRSRCS